MVVHLAGSRKKEVIETSLNSQVALRDGVRVFAIWLAKGCRWDLAA